MYVSACVHMHTHVYVVFELCPAQGVIRLCIACANGCMLYEREVQNCMTDTFTQYAKHMNEDKLNEVQLEYYT